MTSLLIRILVVWIMAITPVFMGLPTKAIFSIWGFIAVISILIPPGNRTIRSLFLYTACISFTSVDYLSSAPNGFVGGAPPALAFYPVDLLLIPVILFGILEEKLMRPKGIFGLLLVLGWLWTLVAFASVLSGSMDIATMQQALVMPRGMLAGYLIWSFCRSRRDTVIMGMALTAGLGFQVVIGALQHFRGDVTGLHLLGEAPADQLSKYIAYGIKLWRAGGTLGHPNVFASYLIATIPIGAALVAVCRGAGRRLILSVLVAGGLFVLIWTYSRGAWLVAGIVTLYAIIVGIRTLFRGYALAGAAIVLTTVFIVGFPSIRHRIEQTERSATDVRIELLSIATDMVTAYPATGVGLGAAPSRLPSFDPNLRLELFRHPVHNIIMLDFAEMGVPGGLISILLFGGSLVWAALKIRRGMITTAWLEAGFSVGVAALVLHNLVDWTLRVPHIILLFWILLALADIGGES